MGKVNLEINGRKYALGCDDGEEERLLRLGNSLNERVQSLANQFGQIGDVRLLVMAGIMMEDELAELENASQSQAEEMTADIRTEADRATKAAAKTETQASDALSDAAVKIEKLAERLRRDIDA